MREASYTLEAERLNAELHDAIIKTRSPHDKDGHETALALAVAGIVGNIATSLERIADRLEKATDGGNPYYAIKTRNVREGS